MKCLLSIEIGNSTSSNFKETESGSNPKALNAKGTAKILFHPSTSKSVSETSRSATFFETESCSRIPFVSIFTPSRAIFGTKITDCFSDRRKNPRILLLFEKYFNFEVYV